MSAPERPPPRNAKARVAAGSGGATGQQGQAESTTAEAPEHRGDRRRFLVWAVLAGFAPPERLTDAIVADVEREATP